MKFATTRPRSFARVRRWAISLGTALTAAVTAANFAVAAETRRDPHTGHQGPGGADSSIHSPYASVPSTRDTGLLPQEVQDLLKGEGMALALPAELNGYPGPRHVLDAATTSQLDLPTDQRDGVQRLFERMSREAKAKGDEILQAEADLAMRFRFAHIDEGSLRQMLEHIGRLRADLRFIHLRTHLETKTLLTPEQVARYNALRGYDAGGAGPGHRH